MKKYLKRLLAGFLAVIMICSTIYMPDVVKADPTGEKWISVENGPGNGGGHDYGQASGPSFLYDSNKTMPIDGEVSFQLTPLNEPMNFGVFYTYRDDNTWLYIGYDKTSKWYYQYQNGSNGSYPQLSGLPNPVPGEPMQVSVALSRETLVVKVNEATVSVPDQSLLSLTEEVNGDGKFGFMAKGNTAKLEFADFTLNQQNCMDDDWQFLVSRQGQVSNVRYAQLHKIEGTVVDENDNPLSSVVVRIGSDKTATDDNGQFSFKDIESGSYTLSATVPGYRPASQKITIDTEDITGLKIVMVSKEAIDKDDYDHISSDSMTAYLGKDFPVVARYEIGEDFFDGQEEAIDTVNINGVPIAAEVTPQDGFTSGTPSKTYCLALQDAASGIDLEMDVMISIDRNNLTWEVTRIDKKSGCPDIKTIEVPELNLLTIGAAQPGAEFAGAKASTTTTVTGDVFKTFDDGFKPGEKSGYLYGFVSNDKFSAGLWSNSEAEGDERVALRCGPDTMSLTSAPWYYERGDKKAMNTKHTFPVKSELPCVKVSIAGDLNQDGKIDWNDGALGFRQIMNYPYGSEKVKELVNYRIAMNFASMAPNPYLKTADNVKKVYLATDGLAQALMLKGYGSEGHDSANSEYADIATRQGGVEDFNKLINIAHQYNTEIGVHVNAQEAYPEAASFCEELVTKDNGTAEGFGWGWLDQSYQINKLWDLSSQARWKRFVQLYDRINGTSFYSRQWPLAVENSQGTAASLDTLQEDSHNRPGNMDFIYLDVWYQDTWETRRVAEEINALGWRFTTEFSDQGEYDSTWQHWATDAVYGGAAMKGFNSDLIRFLRNDHRDSQVLNYPAFKGTADKPLLGGYRLYGFEGWQGDQDFDSYIFGTYNENLPTKFLQHYYVTKWENYEEGQSPVGNHEKQITLQNDNGDTVVVTRKEQQRNDDNIARTITLNGRTVLDDVTYLLPWTDAESGEEKLYHWNMEGGTTTWDLPDGWNLATVKMYKLSDQGRINEQTINVADGKVTLTADSATAYILVKGAEIKTLKNSFGEINYIVDPGFNGYAGNGEKLAEANWSGDISSPAITIEKSPVNDQMLVIDSPDTSTSVSTVISGLMPGEHYVAQIYADNQSDEKAFIEVETNAKTFSNYTQRSIAQNYVQCDDHHRGSQMDSYMQIMQVSFVADAQMAKLTLRREAGAGATYLTDIRIVPIELNNYRADGSFVYDFETVVQGIYPFVLGPAQGVSDPSTHLSQLHDIYTQSGWRGRVLDDVIEGNWSLKHHGKNTGIIYQTIPQNFRFEPGKVYKVSFDYQSGADNGYAFVTGNAETYDKPPESEYLSATVAADGGKAATAHHEMQVMGAMNGQTWIGLYSNSVRINSNNPLGGYDFILDNLKIEEDTDAFEIAVHSTELFKGEMGELIVAGHAPNDVAWEIDNKDVVTLSADKQHILAIGAGTATIKASVGEGKDCQEKTITVKVSDKVLKDIPTGKDAAAYANTFQPNVDGEGPPSYAIDQRADTFWHCAWSGFTVSDSNPAILTIDLGEEMAVSGFKFQQRPAINNGIVEKYKYVYGNIFTPETHKIEDGVSSDPIKTSTGGGEWMYAEFGEVKEVRYIQVQVLRGRGDLAAIAQVVPTMTLNVADSAALSDQIMKPQTELIIEPDHVPGTILKGIRWSSSDENVVKVESLDKDGSKARLTADTKGTATITITNAAGLRAAATIVVSDESNVEDNYYTVTFNPNGGTVSQKTIEVKEGAAIGKLPIPAKKGFVFTGWYTAKTGGKKITASTTVTKGMEVYARWNEVAHAIGTKFKVGSLTYQVKGKASKSRKGTVAVVGLAKKVSTITIPATVNKGSFTYNVESIAKKAFADNRKLTGVTVGSRVKTIGVSAFAGCSSLTSVKLGKALTKIGNSAFKNCKKLKMIRINSTKLKKAGKNAFKGIHKNAMIKVPGSKLNSYKKILKGKGQKATVIITK